MVTFRADLSYSYAQSRGDKQNEVLMKICSQTDDVDSLDTEKIMEMIRQL